MLTNMSNVIQLSYIELTNFRKNIPTSSSNIIYQSFFCCFHIEQNYLKSMTKKLVKKHNTLTVCNTDVLKNFKSQVIVSGYKIERQFEFTTEQPFRSGKAAGARCSVYPPH